MRKLSPLIIAFMCVSILTLQLVGLHAHLDFQSGDAELHRVHLHDVDSDGHDHSSDIDVSVFDDGFVWTKLFAFLISCSVLLVVISGILQVAGQYFSNAPPPKHGSYRRPPLRAPPRTA